MCRTENLKPLFFLDDVFQASSIQLKNGVLNKQTIPRLEGARAAIQKAVEAAQSFLQSHQLQHRFTKSELNFTPDRLDFADATTRMKNPEMLSLAKRIWFSASSLWFGLGFVQPFFSLTLQNRLDCRP
jgi:hypothetical protein